MRSVPLSKAHHWFIDQVLTKTTEERFVEMVNGYALAMEEYPPEEIADVEFVLGYDAHLIIQQECAGLLSAVRSGDDLDSKEGGEALWLVRSDQDPDALDEFGPTEAFNYAYDLPDFLYTLDPEDMELYPEYDE